MAQKLRLEKGFARVSAPTLAQECTIVIFEHYEVPFLRRGTSRWRAILRYLRGLRSDF
jgi:hypothetical protein